MAEKDRLGDQVEKVIKAVVPKRFIPKDCGGCAQRKAGLNKLPGFHPFKGKY